MKEFWTFLAKAGNVFSAIWDAITFVFNVTFAQLWTVVSQIGNFEAFPLWKQILIVVVILAFIGLLALSFLEIVYFIWAVLRAVGAMFVSWGTNLIYMLILAFVAFGGAYVLNNHRGIPWLNWLP